MLKHSRPSLNAISRRVPTPFFRAHFESTSATHAPDTRSSSARPTHNPLANRQDAKEPAIRGKKLARDGSPAQKPLLKPYALSERLIKLCDEDKVDEAIDLLTNMPLDSQNTTVWNTMIRLVGRASRFQRAYQLYIEMKRRGFKPNGRTYSTLMAAFAKVPSWSDRTKLIGNVHKAYDNYLTYLEAVRSHNPESPELSIIPINVYLTVLSKAKDYQRMFDVYNSLDSLHLSPDGLTYTVMLYTLGHRSIGETGDDARAQAVRERAASDARLIWRHVTKRLDKGEEIRLDAQLIDAAIQPLVLGRPADQIVAFDILRDYAGLAKPGETAPPPRVNLTPVLLSDVLWLCNTSKKYRLTVHFVQQLMKTNPDVLDRGHMDHVLAAYGALSAMGTGTEGARALQTLEWMLEQSHMIEEPRRLRPGLSSFTLALVACWRGKDWENALRMFELMTGYLGQDFADGTVVAEPKPIKRNNVWNILPDAAAISCLVRAAHTSGDPAYMRQCARIVRHLGLTRLLNATDAVHKEMPRAPPRFKKDTSFYAHKTASALVELVDVLVPKKTDNSEPLTDEQREWTKLRSEAKTYLTEQRHQRPQVTPLLEESPLGSEQGLAATDDAVVWDRISRENRTRPSYSHT